jgi:hypothetical protein
LDLVFGGGIMHGVSAVRRGKAILVASVIAFLSCWFASGLGAQEFTTSQPRPPASHSGLACASPPEQARLQALLKSWRAAYAEWESALAKVEGVKPAYNQAQAELDEALAHERSFPTQLMGIARGSWSPELFAAAERRNAAYGKLRASTEEAERAFGALQGARSADEQLTAEISKRTCARPRAQPPTQADPPAGAGFKPAPDQPAPSAQPQLQPQPCRQAIVSEVFRCQ